MVDTEELRDEVLEGVREVWDHYFRSDPLISDDDPRIDVIVGLVDFFRNAGACIVAEDQLATGEVVRLNYGDMLSKLPYDDFADALLDTPTETLATVALALAVERHSRFPSLAPRPITVRLAAVTPITPLRALKANKVGKFVALKGTVVRVSNVRPLVMRMSFGCQKCGTENEVCFKDGMYEPPTRCLNQGCRSRSFVCKRETAVTRDWQRIKIQELSEDPAEAGRIPRTIEAEFTEDLVDCVVPGDTVTINGIVKAVNAQVAAGGGTARAQSLFLIYIDVMGVDLARRGTGDDAAQFSQKELLLFETIMKEPDPFALVVASLCPSIYGHELVKAGLALGLFGGSRVEGPDALLAPRADPHILVVGDPGLGKSQLLRATSEVAPRGVYVCGNTTSTTGLTVTIVRDSGGDYSLEAGALVLGDSGVCCIDEFDKMGSEHQALLEAMEQQQISIAKAGIVASLSARTTVLAAANPVGGHYDRGKTVQENLKLSAPLLSRFDLIYILLDNPDDARDAKLSAHVMSMHSRNTHGRADRDTRSAAWQGVSRAAGSTMPSTAGSQPRIPGTYQASSREPSALARRLQERVAAFKSTDLLPGQLLRKYISYARLFIMPRLSKRAAKVIQEFYLTLRSTHGDSDSTPITTRQLESMIRLAQARAKVDLRSVVTKDDAQDVVDLMRDSLFDVCTDEFGFVDFSRTTGMSRGKQVKMFVAAMNRKAREKGSATFTYAELCELITKTRLRLESNRDFLEILNQQNYILKRGGNTYQLLTSVYSQTGRP